MKWSGQKVSFQLYFRYSYFVMSLVCFSHIFNVEKVNYDFKLVSMHPATVIMKRI